MVFRWYKKFISRIEVNISYIHFHWRWLDSSFRLDRISWQMEIENTYMYDYYSFVRLVYGEIAQFSEKNEILLSAGHTLKLNGAYVDSFLTSHFIFLRLSPISLSVDKRISTFFIFDFYLIKQNSFNCPNPFGFRFKICCADTAWKNPSNRVHFYFIRIISFSGYLSISIYLSVCVCHLQCLQIYFIGKHWAPHLPRILKRIFYVVYSIHLTIACLKRICLF